MLKWCILSFTQRAGSPVHRLVFTSALSEAEPHYDVQDVLLTLLGGCNRVYQSTLA